MQFRYYLILDWNESYLQNAQLVLIDGQGQKVKLGIIQASMIWIIQGSFSPLISCFMSSRLVYLRNLASSTRHFAKYSETFWYSIPIGYLKENFKNPSKTLLIIIAMLYKVIIGFRVLLLKTLSLSCLYNWNQITFLISLFGQLYSLFKVFFIHIWYKTSIHLYELSMKQLLNGSRRIDSLSKFKSFNY